MKKWIVWMLVIMMAAAAVPALAEEADVLAKIREKGTLTIAMEGVWQPWRRPDCRRPGRSAGICGNSLGRHSGRRGFRTV